MSKKTTKTTVKEEISEKENNPIASSSVVVKAEITNLKAEVNPAEEEDQSNWKPGQKYPTPSPGSGDRVFYETLYHQKPESEMAQEWCVMYGVLEYDEALKVYERICKRKGKAVELTASQTSKTKSPQKQSRPAPAPPAKAAAASSSRKRKAVVEDDIEGDTGLEAGGVWEGAGTSGL